MGRKYGKECMSRLEDTIKLRNEHRNLLIAISCGEFDSVRRLVRGGSQENWARTDGMWGSSQIR